MDTQISEQSGSKKNLFIAVIIILIIAAAAGWWWSSKNQAVPIEGETALEESQFTPEAINQELESIDTGDLEKEFQNIDQDLNSL